MADMRTGAASEVVLTVDDEPTQPIGVELEGWSFSGPERQVRLAPSTEDTSGQSLAGGTTVNVIVYGEDVEGQAMTLRFPTPSDAANFQRRLLMTGALAGTLAAASIGASLSLQAQNATTGAPLAAPAPAYAHDLDKVGSVGVAPPYAHDASKLGIPAATGKVGNVTPEISRIGDAGTSGVSAGAEAKAKAAAAAAAGPSLAGGGATDDSERDAPSPTSQFRGR